MLNLQRSIGDQKTCEIQFANYSGKNGDGVNGEGEGVNGEGDGVTE